MPLTDYINLHFNGNQSDFARHMNKPRQKIQEWIRGEWIVVEINNTIRLYSPRHEIPAK